ncbi:MAG: PRTRC system protein C [Flavobacterium sp. 38-13]|uniref:PRTRC system protein C n=1 Tax=Flavobacterium TaxID=237 RepID=UPI00095C3A9B|nr:MULTISPECIES: PRTRC system protein C [Flavobacterium]OJX54882.1 MAG: PRTRC system protein C [Flavobacterium sp. 38-13]
MLLATEIERVFVFDNNGNEITLTDPEPRWSEEAVLDFYANSYPILTTAKISAPKFRDDKILYRFESVIGTKG